MKEIFAGILTQTQDAIADFFSFWTSLLKEIRENERPSLTQSLYCVW